MENLARSWQESPNVWPPPPPRPQTSADSIVTLPTELNYTVTKLKVKFPYIHRVTQTTTSHARKNFPPLGRGFYLHSTGQLKNLRKFPENIVIQKMREQGLNQRPLDYNPNTRPLHHGSWCLIGEKYLYLNKVFVNFVNSGDYPVDRPEHFARI